MAAERNFEKNMKRLEEIVSKLESGEISLEESLQLYKEGAQCSRFCRDELARARHEVEIWNLDEDKDSSVNSATDSYEVPF